MEKRQQHLARSTVLVMTAFAFSRVLGLVRQVAFGLYFGTGPEMDAYVAAARLPELLFMVVAGGALGAAFIPVFTARLAVKDTAGAWRLASAIINLLLLLLVPLSLLAMLLAPWLVRTIIAPDFTPVLQARTALLLRIMLLSPAIFGVSGILMGALNAHQHFLIPAVAPSVYNLVLIGGAIWGGRVGGGAMGAAVATVVGSLAHLLMQVLWIRRYHPHYAFILGWDDPHVREVVRLTAPRILGVAAMQLNFLITNNLASGLGTGAVSALNYAWTLTLLPHGIFAQAIGVTIFPTLSEQAARGEYAALRQTVSTALRLVIALMLPAMGGLVVLGRPLVALLLEHGEFGAASTQMVAWAIGLFAIGLVGLGGVEVLARAFYAVHDTWTPALAAVGALLLNLILGLTLPALFVRRGWPPHGGLALANGLAALAELGALLLLVGRRLQGFEGRRLLSQALRASAATAGMTFLVWLWLRIAPPNALLQSVGGIAVGVGGYALLALLLRVDDLRLVVNMVLRRK
ncbi:MAG: murein biosynthesis integral membrane protein MurJ [Chloroflexi bacterium]|nr:MAG: murein biosynthesis integral membrane protein MurJ [Chloroflexota bacterium]